MSRSAPVNETAKTADRLDWIYVREESDNASPMRSIKEHAIQKTLENPFVPIGCAVTIGALSYGVWSFLKGRTQRSQHMMRVRVAAQGFTILAMVAGFFFNASKQQK